MRHGLCLCLLGWAVLSAAPAVAEPPSKRTQLSFALPSGVRVKLDQTLVPTGQPGRWHKTTTRATLVAPDRSRTIVELGGRFATAQQTVAMDFDLGRLVASARERTPPGMGGTITLPPSFSRILSPELRLAIQSARTRVDAVAAYKQLADYFDASFGKFASRPEIQPWLQRTGPTVRYQPTRELDREILGPAPR